MLSETDFISAIERGDTQAIENDVRAGRDPNQQVDGEYPIMTCITYRQPGCLQVVLTNDADPNVTDEHGLTPLMRAIQFDFDEMIDMLIDFDADLEVKTPAGTTALMMAVQVSNDRRVVDRLVAAGAQVGATNKAGETAIDIATRIRGRAEQIAAMRSFAEPADSSS